MGEKQKSVKTMASFASRKLPGPIAMATLEISLVNCHTPVLPRGGACSLTCKPNFEANLTDFETSSVFLGTTMTRGLFLK